MIVLLPPENLKARFFVPETLLSKIQMGGRVRVKADGAAPVMATVNYVSSQAEFTPPVIYSRETRAKLVFMVEAALAPADAVRWRPGQPIDVQVNP